VSAAADRLICVAPMMDCTDRHCRYFLRLLSPDAGLYTEMVTAQAIVHGDREQLLAFDPAEHPLSLQLGGSDPEMLARAISIAEGFGYDEFNLNIGCPSDRVQSGRFGACLMYEPARVADCVEAMIQASSQPVTVKTRIGVDDQDDYGFLESFVGRVADAGCRTLIVHARKAILAGLTPKQNRDIPPLRYDTVYRLKKDFAQLRIVLNGGIDSAAAVADHLRHVDGVMIGRKAYADPWFLAELQAGILAPESGVVHDIPDRETVIRKMAAYADREIGSGTRLHHITRHMLGMFNGQPGARRWRRFISQQGIRRDADSQVLHDSLSLLRDAA
jgi:tRNA-dihydrouridine synthase A